MMLLAFTRRALRVSQISLANWPASCVSLAAARACSPSLLTISTSVFGIAGVRIQVDHTLLPAAQGLGHHRGERLAAVGQCPDQHRQIDAGNALHPARH